MNVLNFDSRKVWVGKNTVRKHTSLSEYQQFCMAKDYLKLNPVILDCGILVKTAPLISWADDSLITEFCSGLNLEHALIQKADKLSYIKIIRDLLFKFRENGFLWGDIAPRNMVLDESSNIIYIFDFERRFIIKDNPLGKETFSRFFRNYAYEEFSCVLFPSDQELLFDDLLTVNSEGEILTSEIESRRKKRLLEQFWGKKEKYLVKEVCLAENLMSVTATPFMVDNQIVYPMFSIEKIVKKGGSYAYTEIVKAFKGCSSGTEKIAILEDAIKRFFPDG